MGKTMKRIGPDGVGSNTPNAEETKGKYHDPEKFAAKLNSIIHHDNVTNDVNIRIEEMKEIGQNLVGVSMVTNVRALKKLDPSLK